MAVSKDVKPIDYGDDSLFLEYVHTGDTTIREKIIEQEQDLVRFLASKFANRGEPIEDLIQVGTIGLINAIDRFDPSRGIRFSTYATPTIVGEIKRYFRDKSWGFKVPRRLQKLNLAASRTAERLSRELGRDATIREIAEVLHASEEETLEAIELGGVHKIISLDAPINQDEDTPSDTADFLGWRDNLLDNITRFDDLRQALSHLEPKEKAVVHMRYFKQMSQAEIAKELKISQMHVSRLQKRALNKLRELLEL